MKQFKQYIQENIDTVNMIELTYFLENCNDSLDESVIKDISDKFKSMLPKFGLKAKSGKGLIQILGTTSKHIGILLYYAFKVSQGDDTYKEKIKDIIKKVSKEDFLDVLFRLDLLTLHAITGPIHIIDALTGWHLGVNIQQNKDVNKRAERVLTHLNNMSANTIGETKKKLKNIINQLKSVFKYSSQIWSEIN